MRAIIVVALAAIAIHLPNLPFGKAPQEDAGVFLYTAQRILDGGLPYRDVWDHKPPLIYVLDALGLILGGGSALGVWALQTIGYVVAAVVSFLVFAQAFGARAALFGTVAWLLAVPRIMLVEGYFTNFVQLFAAPLQFAALALFLDEERERRRTWRSAAIGVTAGLAALLSPAALGLWVALGLFVTGGRLRAGSLGGAVARGSAMLAGAALPVLVAGAALAAMGILGDALDQAVRYNSTYTGTVTWANRASSLTFGLRLLASGGFLLVALGGAGWALLAARDRTLLPRASEARRLVSVALLALPIEVLLGSSSGREHGYYWIAALPGLAVLTTFAAFAFERRLAPSIAARLRRRPMTVTAAALAFVLLALAARPVLLMARVAQSTEDGLTSSAVAYLREQTGPGDTVLIWGSRAAVNFDAKRRSPTRYVYQYAPLSTRGYDARPHVAELKRILDERPPKLVVDASRDSAVTPALEVAAGGTFDTQDPLFVFSPRVAEVASSILERYERVGTVGPSGWPVYRLRSR